MISPVPDPAESEIAADRAADTDGPRGRPVADVRAALATLTRLPIDGVSGARSGASAFALVGAIVGLAGFLPLVALGASIPLVAAILAVAIIAVLTGAIHLDGLADTADALIASGPDGAERARKDPSVGVGGAVAIVLVLGLEASSLALLVVDAGPLAAGLACVLAATVSRAVPVVLGLIARRHARGSGLGGWFAARATIGAATVAIGSTVLLSLAAGLVLGSSALPTAGLVGGAGGVALGLGLVRLRGQLDGDLLGASIELSFALVLMAAAALVAGPGA